MSADPLAFGHRLGMHRRHLSLRRRSLGRGHEHYSKRLQVPLLAGRIAEEIVLGAISLSPVERWGSDPDQGTRLAAATVASLGLAALVSLLG
jgi:hypothetical protein